MQKINIKQKLDQFQDYWNPRIVGELNGQQIRLVKVKGEFTFHKHDNEDEMFLVIKGSIIIDFKDRQTTINEGEFCIVPRGAIHKPVAEEEAHLMLFVKAGNVNTGDTVNNLTRINLEKL